jgi:hypothetical protein
MSFATLLVWLTFTIIVIIILYYVINILLQPNPDQACCAI